MSEHVLTLNVDQLYEVYNAAWREFVGLHTQIMTNPNGVSRHVIERVRLSRAAIGQVCDMIEAMQPDWSNDRYSTARAQAKLTDGLNGKDFAMLADDELQRFRHLQREGRKLGLTVWVEVINDGDDVQAELAAASPAQKEDIYRRLRTEVVVRPDFQE